MGDMNEGDTPYVGWFCECGLLAPFQPRAAKGESCPDCGRAWPEFLCKRYPYDGGPEIRSLPRPLENSLDIARYIIAEVNNDY